MSNQDKTTAPQWPEHVELVEVTPLNLKPGDTLVVKAKEGHDFGPHVAYELLEYLEACLPEVRIVVIGLPVDLEVATDETDAD